MPAMFPRRKGSPSSTSQPGKLSNLQQMRSKSTQRYSRVKKHLIEGNHALNSAARIKAWLLCVQRNELGW